MSTNEWQRPQAKNNEGYQHNPTLKYGEPQTATFSTCAHAQNEILKKKKF
jgi:hypothetical protein